MGTMASDNLQEKARKKVQAKKGLFIHMGVFVVTAIFLLVVNLMTYTFEDVWWFYFPLIPWSLAVAIHYLVVLGVPGTDIFSSAWEEREYEKELEELEWRAYRKSRMRLPQHSVDESLDLDELSKLPKQKLDDRDFV